MLEKQFIDERKFFQYMSFSSALRINKKAKPGVLMNITSFNARDYSNCEEFTGNFSHRLTEDAWNNTFEGKWIEPVLRAAGFEVDFPKSVYQRDFSEVKSNLYNHHLTVLLTTGASYIYERKNNPLPAGLTYPNRLKAIVFRTAKIFIPVVIMNSIVNDLINILFWHKKVRFVKNIADFNLNIFSSQCNTIVNKLGSYPKFADEFMEKFFPGLILSLKGSESFHHP